MRSAAATWASAWLLGLGAVVLTGTCAFVVRHVALPRPVPGSAPAAQFSELRARESLASLVELGPKPLGSQALHAALQLVLSSALEAQRLSLSRSSSARPSHEEATDADNGQVCSPSVPGAQVQVPVGVNVDVDVQVSGPGALRRPRSLAVLYDGITNVVVRVRPVCPGDMRGVVLPEEGEVSTANPTGPGEEPGGSNPAECSLPGDKEGKQRPALLVVTHVDTVFTSPGAGDCASNVAVMLELLHNVVAAFSSSNQGSGSRTSSSSRDCLEHSGSSSGNGSSSSSTYDPSAASDATCGTDLIFLFNTGEEEGLVGAHAFVTQHPWARAVLGFLNLESIGPGGRSFLTQAGPSPHLLRHFQAWAPRPNAQMLGQDIFRKGLIGSRTDFEVFALDGGLSGLDFAYEENTAVYHTKYDELRLVRPGSLQHLGDNLLPLLTAALASPTFFQDDTCNTSSMRSSPGLNSSSPGIGPLGFEQPTALLHSADNESCHTDIFVDILGRFLVLIRPDTASAIYAALAGVLCLVLALLLLFSPVALLLSLLSQLLTIFLSLVLAAVPSLLLPLLSPSHPIPYLPHPYLASAAFSTLALSGALMGSGIGHGMLRWRLQRTSSRASALKSDASAVPASSDICLSTEARSWQSFSGMALWMSLLLLAWHHNWGSAYIPAVWAALPLFACTYSAVRGLLKPRTRHPGPSPCSLPLALLSTALPLLLSVEVPGVLAPFMVGVFSRLDMTLGGVPPWAPNLVLGCYCATVTALYGAYFIPLAHFHKAGRMLVPFFALLGSSILGSLVIKGTAFSASAPQTFLVLWSHHKAMSPLCTASMGQEGHWVCSTGLPTDAAWHSQLILSSLTPGLGLQPMQTSAMSQLNLTCYESDCPAQGLAISRPIRKCCVAPALGTRSQWVRCPRSLEEKPRAKLSSRCQSQQHGSHLPLSRLVAEQQACSNAGAGGGSCTADEDREQEPVRGSDVWIGDVTVQGPCRSLLPGLGPTLDQAGSAPDEQGEDANGVLPCSLNFTLHTGGSRRWQLALSSQAVESVSLSLPGRDVLWGPWSTSPQEDTFIIAFRTGDWDADCSGSSFAVTLVLRPATEQAPQGTEGKPVTSPMEVSDVSQVKKKDGRSLLELRCDFDSQEGVHSSNVVTNLTVRDFLISLPGFGSLFGKATFPLILAKSLQLW